MTYASHSPSRGAREEFSQPAASGGAGTSSAWTPVPLASTGTITPNAGGTFGKLITNGDLRIAWFQITVTSVAAPTGTLRITGLPVGTGIPNTSFEQSFVANGQGLAAGANTQLVGRVLVNENPAVLRVYAYQSGNLVLLAPFVQAGAVLWGQATWIVNA